MDQIILHKGIASAAATHILMRSDDSVIMRVMPPYTRKNDNVSYRVVFLLPEHCVHLPCWLDVKSVLLSTDSPSVSSRSIPLAPNAPSRPVRNTCTLYKYMLKRQGVMGLRSKVMSHTQYAWLACCLPCRHRASLAAGPHIYTHCPVCFPPRCLEPTPNSFLLKPDFPTHSR